jgi:vacuolar-type H+-ATPase subunit I/STV1
MKNRYPALAFVAGCSKLIGWLVAIVGITGAIIVIVASVTIRTPYGLLGVGAAFLSLPFTLWAAVNVIAHGEWIELHLELAANTRPESPDTFTDEPLDWAA